jgi:hypothetical protein
MNNEETILTEKEPPKLNWNEALKTIQFKLADWLLYNRQELTGLVLHEEFGLGIGDGTPDPSLDSQVERFITSSQHRLYILNLTGNYIESLELRKRRVYQFKYEMRFYQDDITELVNINKNTVTAWVKDIREGLLDDLEEGGVMLDNIYRFKQKYKWVGEKEKGKVG